MVSVLAFFPDDLSSNPAEVLYFSVNLYLKRTKDASVGPFFLKKVRGVFVVVRETVDQVEPDLPVAKTEPVTTLDRDQCDQTV